MAKIKQAILRKVKVRLENERPNAAVNEMQSPRKNRQKHEVWPPLFSPCLDSLGFVYQLRQGQTQCSCQRFRNVQARISQASLKQTNVRRMQLSLFRQGFLREIQRCSVLPERDGKGVRHFQPPHSVSLGTPASMEHRQ